MAKADLNDDPLAVRSREIPAGWLKLATFAVIALFISVLLSTTSDYVLKRRDKDAALMLEMAKLHYCLRAVEGSAQLQYQPCQSNMALLAQRAE